MKQSSLNVLLLIFIQLLLSISCYAESTPVTLHLWPESFLGESVKKKETVLPDKGNGVTRITDIGNPTLTLYQVPNAAAPSPAVLLCPGGGYRILAINKEGTELAEWFNSIGVAAFVLKYRVPNDRTGALQDAQRAMGLIRHNAKKWNIDSNKVGVMGFSAGGHLAASLSNHFERRTYPRVDDADTLDCRPDFTMLIYPAYLSGKDYELKDEVTISDKTPACFLLQTQDDKNHVDSSIAYYLACKEAGVPAELHLYSEGGHGYGMRESEHPVSKWTGLCATWLKNLIIARDQR